MTIEDRLRQANPHQETASPPPPRHVASSIIEGRRPTPWKGPLIAAAAAAAVVVVALAGSWALGNGSPASTTVPFAGQDPTTTVVGSSTEQEIILRLEMIAARITEHEREIAELEALIEAMEGEPDPEGRLVQMQRRLVESLAVVERLRTEQLALQASLGSSNDPNVSSTTTVSTTCSARGMVGPGPNDGLPPEVAALRDTLFGVAANCNWGILKEYTPDSLLWSFGTAGDREDAIREWQRAEGNGVPVLRNLAGMLDTTPGVIEDGGQRIWVWPAAATYDRWDEIPDEALREIQPYLTQEDVEAHEAFGAYGGWRVGIAEDGTWMFFIAGD